MRVGGENQFSCPIRLHFEGEQQLKLSVIAKQSDDTIDLYTVAYIAYDDTKRWIVYGAAVISLLRIDFSLHRF